VATEIAGNLFLDLGDDSLVLRDTALSGLSEGDFLFV
jgi:hypothetical protein